MLGARGVLEGKQTAGRLLAPLALPTTSPPQPGCSGGCWDPLVLRGIPTPALNTAPTRDLDLPIALWFLPSPPDSVVGTSNGETNPGC